MAFWSVFSLEGPDKGSLPPVRTSRKPSFFLSESDSAVLSLVGVHSNRDPPAFSRFPAIATMSVTSSSSFLSPSDLRRCVMAQTKACQLKLYNLSGP